jgi:hypothetical protein
MSRVPPFTVQDIVRASQGALVAGDLGIPVTGVSIDSRSLARRRGVLRHPRPPPGRPRLPAEAAARGAACLIVHTLPDDVPANVPLVLVEDTTRALGRLAAWHRGRFTDPRGCRSREQRQDDHEGADGRRDGHALERAQAGAVVQQPVGPAAHAAAADARAPGRDAGDRLQRARRGRRAGRAGRATVGIVTTVAAVHTEFLGSLDGVREEKAG